MRYDLDFKPEPFELDSERQNLGRGGRWIQRGNMVVVFPETSTSLPEVHEVYELSGGSISSATPRVLTYSTKDVIDKRISVPAQHSLVRLSKNSATSADAVGMLEEVKAGRLEGIYCVNWQKTAHRALRFGRTWWTAIPPDEDAVLMLDPDSPTPLSGQPLIAFRRELDPRDKHGCGKLKTDKTLTPSPARLDAALLKAWASYKTWQNSGRPDPETSQVIKCTIKPQNGNGVLAEAQIQGAPLARTLSNVIPPLLCQLLSQPVPPACLDSPCLVGQCLTHCLDGVTIVPGGNKIRGQFKMCPERMNPGFIDASTDKVNKNQDLQSALERLLASTKYKSLQPRNRIGVALVDLTGKKHFSPEFAGFRETVQFFGSSVPKIAALYAIFQLQHDLQVLAKQKRIITRGDLITEARTQWDQEKLRRRSHPKIEELFDLGEVPRVKLSRDLENLICCTFHLSCNRTASLLIDKIGFPYLSSVLWQSGLFHKTRGGLWLQSFYPMTKNCPRNCREGAPNCDDVLSRDQLTSRPVTVDAKVIRQPSISPQNVTALSAATYFTLMAQERLVSADASRHIKKELSRACTFFASDPDGDPTDDACKRKGFENNALPLTVKNIAVKCGYNPPPPITKQQVTHDCILVERQISQKKLRYVVVLLTENVSVRRAPLIGQQAHCFFRNQFLVDVDDLIQKRNA
jgi:hypothetical protein